MRQQRITKYELSQVNKFIYSLYIIYGHGLSWEECLEVSLLEYAEARHDLGYIYNSYQGEDDLDIIERLHMGRDEYYEIKLQLQNDMKVYMEI